MYHHQAVFYLVALCLLSVTVQGQPKRRCTGKAANVMFVMDSSSSIWIVDYKKQLKFVQDLVDNFDIGAEDTQVRVGAITFSDRAYLEFSIDKYTDSEEIKTAIGKIPYRTGQTDTAAALKLVRTDLEPKMKTYTAPFIAVVITDGRSRDPQATRKQANLLHKLGFHVYTIGVGYSYDLNELKAIASDPVNNVYQVSSYSYLGGIAKSFGAKTCEDIILTTTTTTTTTPEPTTTTPEPTTTTPESTTTTPEPTTTTPEPTTTTTPEPTTTTPEPTTATPEPTTTTPEPTTTTPEPTTTTPEPTTTTPEPTTTTPEHTTITHEPTTTTPEPTTTTQQPELPQGDGASKSPRDTITFGFNLLSMGTYRAGMIIEFINIILPYTHYGHYSIVSFADCSKGLNIPITSLKNKTDSSPEAKLKIPGLVEVVRQMGKDLHHRNIRNAYQGHMGQEITVIFVEPSVTDITPEVVKETDKLKQLGSKVFLVNVGSTGWPQPQLFYGMSSHPYNHYIYTAPTYKELLLKARRTPFQFGVNCGCKSTKNERLYHKSSVGDRSLAVNDFTHIV